VTGSTAPIVWFVKEKAASTTEELLPLFQDITSGIATRLAPTPGPTPTAP